MLSDDEHYDVIILGAGAAGLFCAFTAAQRGRRVLVLEKSNKVGKKILMSGGGRCNFTNLYVDADNFVSANPHFCKSALARYTQWDFIAMVERHQIEYEERNHGQLFCVHSSKDILAMLLRECELVGVQIEINAELGTIENLSTAEQPGFQLEVLQTSKLTGSSSKLCCASLVVASGALSVPTLGGSGKGYDIAAQFGLTLLPRRAGLAPLMFSDSIKAICNTLSGISLEVEVSCQGQSFTGQLLFTHRGISGPVILQISNYWQPGDVININLLPQLEAGILLHSAKAQRGSSLLRSVLQQHLPKSLVAELQALWWPGFGERPLAGFSDKQLASLGKQLNKWTLKPSASEGYRTAEVTLGGVDTNELSSKNMQVKRLPGLFFIGEVVDVSGHLGGFNFQWAWSSGYAAGLCA